MGLLAVRSFRNFNQPWSGSAPLQSGKQAEPRVEGTVSLPEISRGRNVLLLFLLAFRS
jgi:hypothetical protein